MECFMCNSPRKRWLFSFVLITLAVCLSGCGVSGGVGTTPSGGGGGPQGGSVGFSISGGVFLNGLSSGKLEGITVELSGSSSATTTTDSSGIFTFTGLGSGSYTVTPSDVNYTFSPASRTVTIDNSNLHGLNFTATSAK
jgi:hypothetical protein